MIFKLGLCCLMLRVEVNLCRYSAGAVLQIMLFGIMAIQVGMLQPLALSLDRTVFPTCSTNISGLCYSLPHVTVYAAWEAGVTSPTIQLTVHAD